MVVSSWKKERHLKQLKYDKKYELMLSTGTHLTDKSGKKARQTP